MNSWIVWTTPAWLRQADTDCTLPGWNRSGRELPRIIFLFYFIRVFIKRVLLLRRRVGMRSLPRIKKKLFYSKPTKIQDLYLIAGHHKTALALNNGFSYLLYQNHNYSWKRNLLQWGKYNVRILISGNYAIIQWDMYDQSGQLRIFFFRNRYVDNKPSFPTLTIRTIIAILQIGLHKRISIIILFNPTHEKPIPGSSLRITSDICWK